MIAARLLHQVYATVTVVFRLGVGLYSHPSITRICTSNSSLSISFPPGRRHQYFQAPELVSAVCDIIIAVSMTYYFKPTQQIVHRLMRLIIETETLTGDIPRCLLLLQSKTLIQGMILLQPPSQSFIWPCSYTQAIPHTGKPRLECSEHCTPT